MHFAHSFYQQNLHVITMSFLGQQSQRFRRIQSFPLNTAKPCTQKSYCLMKFLVLNEFCTTSSLYYKHGCFQVSKKGIRKSGKSSLSLSLSLTRHSPPLHEVEFYVLQALCAASMKQKMDHSLPCPPGSGPRILLRHICLFPPALLVVPIATA